MNDFPSRNEVALIALHALLSKKGGTPTDVAEQCLMIADAFLKELEEQNSVKD